MGPLECFKIGRSWFDLKQLLLDNGNIVQWDWECVFLQSPGKVLAKRQCSVQCTRVYNFAHICFVLVNASQICSGTCKCNLRKLSTYPCLEAEAGTKEVQLKVFNPCSVPGSKKRGNIPNFAQTCTAHIFCV